MSVIRPSRRGVLTSAAVVGAAGIGAGVSAVASRPAAAGSPTASRTVPFHGSRQAGVTTPAQDSLVFAALDVTTKRAGDLADVLQRWSAAAATMTTGVPVAGRVASAGRATNRRRTPARPTNCRPRTSP